MNNVLSYREDVTADKFPCLMFFMSVSTSYILAAEDVSRDICQIWADLFSILLLNEHNSDFMPLDLYQF